MADKQAELGGRVAALQGKRAAMREEQAKLVEAKRESLRESMPGVAAILDQFREVFGDGVTVIAASEGGKTVKSSRAMRRYGLTDSEVML